MIPRPYPYVPFDTPIPAPPVISGGAVCLEIDRKWLPYIYGALLALRVDRTWENDADRATGEASLLLSQFMNAMSCEVQQANHGVEGDDCMGCCLRWNDGILQILSCGEWVDVPGQTGGQPIPTQPGAGSPQPSAGGGTQRYCGAMSGNSHFYLPTNVNTGDILLFEELRGAWNDGFEVFWHCPDGWLFAAGSCAEPIQYNNAADPLIGTRHMSIVGLIGGTYYDVLQLDSLGNPQNFTVPAGIVDQPVTLVANNDPSLHISGEVTFCVNVTNNQVAQNFASVNFRNTAGGFIPVLDFLGEPESVWTPSQGFEYQDRQIISGVYERAAHTHKSISSIVLTRVEMTYSLHKSTYLDPGNTAVAIIINNSIAASLSASMAVDGDDQVLIWNGSISATDLALFTAASVQSSSVYGGSCAVTAVKAFYNGNVAPF
jgi:hypothetical protein